MGNRMEVKISGVLYVPNKHGSASLGVETSLVAELRLGAR